jgi:diguanylate cyclase (GGDEF)-like protein
VAAAVCAAISMAELAILAVAGSTPHDGRFLIAASVVAGLGILTWLSSVHRARWDRRYMALTHELEALAATDHLTGCLNHRAFNARLKDEIDRALRNGHPLSLIVADVDDFKRVNDTHGHPAGDAALELAGATLRERSRRSDIVGRIGGDEFALLLPEMSLDDAASYAQRVFRPSGTGTSTLTFSAGVASLDLTEPTADHLFREADKALYGVKRNGGRGIAIATRPVAPTQVDVEHGIAR